MKKAILGVCAVTLALALAACGSAPASGSASASQPASEPASQPAEADYTAYSITFEVPESFTQVEPPEGVSAFYQAEDGSSINLVISENDGSLASDVSREDLVSLLEKGFTQQVGAEVTLQDPVFETGRLGDVCPYYRLDYAVMLNDVYVEQTIIGVNADMTYTITFTDMTGDWGQTFADAIASVAPVAQ